MRVSIRKISVYSLVFLLGYIAIPFYLSRHLSGYQFQALALFYFSSIAVIYCTFHRFLNHKNCLLLKIAALEEKINILNNEEAQEHKNSISLQEKIRRYSKLKDIIEELNKNLSLESSANHLITNCLELIANNKGNCILYLLDSNTQKFGLYKAKKEDKKLIIKHKEGDLFDQWVLRHMVPLYINDIKKDFRFDMESVKAHDARPIASLISSPLIT
ncbi:MAG: hypothetical protein FJZ15_07660, partial [Candidatus Omnitrophica bacterium]|nr:hypothetical protein [Candidatus Omnitrophota bacterium]